MKQILNTLYITTRECRLGLSNHGIEVIKPNNEKTRIIGSLIDSIVVFGNTSVTSSLIQWCASHGISLTFLTEGGRFCRRILGGVSGNVTLRMAQYRLADRESPIRTRFIHSILNAKLHNSVIVLQHAARDIQGKRDQLAAAAGKINLLRRKLTDEKNPSEARALEGNAAKIYFSVFPDMISQAETGFRFEGRNRRPPKDPINALLSFIYTLLLNHVQSALESVGLDPECGFMHSIRSGKPALALDMMEEFHSPICDRLVLSLINRRQIKPEDFADQDGEILLSPEARQTVLASWQGKKNETIQHPVPGEKIPIGLLPHCQAQLLARYLREERTDYSAFLWR